MDSTLFCHCSFKKESSSPELDAQIWSETGSFSMCIRLGLFTNVILGHGSLFAKGAVPSGVGTKILEIIFCLP